MRRRVVMALVACLGFVVGSAQITWAQAPGPAPAPPPPPIKKWTSQLSLGMTVTRGNKDAATFNAGYDVKYDPKTGNILTSSGLYIRGTSEGSVSANRLALNGRDERQLNNGRFFVYLQGQFLKDQFKEIEYLVAPTAGMGLKPVDSASTKLSVNAGLGNVWEKNTGRDVRRSGALTLGQRLLHNLSPAVSFTQTISALWKTENLHDSLCTLTAGIAASINARTQFKVEWIDTYKNLPPVGVKKNDLSIIVALVVRH